jgi:hypothetical protein
MLSSMSTNTSTNTSESSDDSTPTRVKRSKVWEYFEPNLVETDDGFKAVCKYCRLQLSTKCETSSLRTHIQKYCHVISDDERNKLVSTMKKPIENFVFDPQFSRECMIEFVIHAKIPFNKFDDPYFEPWIQSMCKTPDFHKKPDSLYHRDSPWISGYRVQNVSQIDTQSHTSHHIKLIVHEFITSPLWSTSIQASWLN